MQENTHYRKPLHPTKKKIAQWPNFCAILKENFLSKRLKDEVIALKRNIEINRSADDSAPNCQKKRKHISWGIAKTMTMVHSLLSESCACYMCIAFRVSKHCTSPTPHRSSPATINSRRVVTQLKMHWIYNRAHREKWTLFDGQES